MRALFRAAPVALALLTIVSLPVSAQGVKVAYVQTSALLEQAPGRAEAEAQFEKETGGYRDQIKKMSDSLNAMVASFEKTQGTLTAANRDARSKDLQAREAEYQRRSREIEQKAQARQNELVQYSRQDQVGDRGRACRGRIRDDLQRGSGVTDRRGRQEPQRHRPRARQAEGFDRFGSCGCTPSFVDRTGTFGRDAPADEPVRSARRRSSSASLRR